MNKRKIISYLIILAGIPLVIIAGATLLRDRRYNVISMLVAVLACVPMFAKFEKRSPDARELVIIAVMTAISATGRFVFAAVPGFKPVTAIVVITAIYFGSEAGFMTGALSALVSNMFFGQGPWTPFQMFVWGFIGLIAGILAKRGLMKNYIVLSIYGVLAGVAFSLMMDIYTVLSMYEAFNLPAYLTAVFASLTFMGMYAVSNVVFLLLLEKPIGKMLQRIKVKYQITSL